MLRKSRKLSNAFLCFQESSSLGLFDIIITKNKIIKMKS